jgi:molybdopterin synthase sulfur carrier subunit
MSKIKLFATLKEAAGVPEIEVSFPDGITVDALRHHVGLAFPALAELAARSVVAINREFAFDEDTVRTADEIALFPPVSGG